MGKTMTEILKGMIRMYSIVPIQLFGLYAVYTIFAGTVPSWWWITTLVGYVCIMMLGVCACYHRMLSHKSFETTRPMKIFMLWCSALSGQGSPIFWATIHRGYHHRYTDQDLDPHSPIHGFWHSYILWMFKIKDGDHNTKYVVDLLRDKDVMFFHKYYNHIFLISHVAVLLISFDLWMYLMILPAFITIHSFSIQNNLNHSKVHGYKNANTNNNGVNVIWLFPLVLGEAWHNNHHADAKNPQFGKRWWELDPTYWLIKLIRIKKD
jgi:stearoyl-CoA desaturase (delta-9 desaturase)